VKGLLGGALVLCFAEWLTLHFALVRELFRVRPRWRALACLLPPLAPLAPYWALKQGMSRWAAAWLLSAGTYIVLFWLAER
jgi:hypothetical protein